MKVPGANIVITGAAGGIGSEIAKQLATKGANLALIDISREKLEKNACLLADSDNMVVALSADISKVAECERVVAEAKEHLGEIDMLINIAGLMNFNEFSSEDLSRMELLFRVNVLAPQVLTRLILPEMIARGRGLIVNMGSMFGSIAFPYHATYSSSKYAVRGFSEALRRELIGTGVSVLYVSPRATRTGLSDEQMAKAAGMNLDTPIHVATRVVAAIEKDKKDCFIGFPESLFARLNGIVPRIIDMGLKKQTKLMQPFATKA